MGTDIIVIHSILTTIAFYHFAGRMKKRRREQKRKSKEKRER